MKDILQEIVAHKRQEVARQKAELPADELRQLIEKTRQAARSMKKALTNSPTGIIAEFKRRSPSKGWIHPDADPRQVTAAYQAAGAAAISVLTDEKFFGGTLADLQTVRQSVELPVLRKDFIIDEYQLLQARAAGADAVLLIAACLTPQECRRLTAQAHELELEVLLEVHSEDELGYIQADTDMTGVNNRNLGTFVTDVANSFRIAAQLQNAASRMAEPVLVSESGISQPETIRQLRQAGFSGFLIGETFMKTEHPGDSLKAFNQQIAEIKQP